MPRTVPPARRILPSPTSSRRRRARGADLRLGRPPGVLLDLESVAFDVALTDQGEGGDGAGKGDDGAEHEHVVESRQETFAGGGRDAAAGLGGNLGERLGEG